MRSTGLPRVHAATRVLPLMKLVKDILHSSTGASMIDGGVVGMSSCNNET